MSHVPFGKSLKVKISPFFAIVPLEGTTCPPIANCPFPLLLRYYGKPLLFLCHILSSILSHCGLFPINRHPSHADKQRRHEIRCIGWNKRPAGKRSATGIAFHEEIPSDKGRKQFHEDTGCHRVSQIKINIGEYLCVRMRNRPFHLSDIVQTYNQTWIICNLSLKIGEESSFVFHDR